MTTAQVVETPDAVNNNSPIQDYVHPHDAHIVKTILTASHATLISDDQPFPSIKNQLQVNLFLVYLQCRTDSGKEKGGETSLQRMQWKGLSI